MNSIDRYVYDVVRRLPERQRIEIDKELRGLIADMLMTRALPPTPQAINTVLMELGDPARLADNYRGSGRYLIGPSYFDKYVSLLRIVMGAVFIGLSVALAVSFMFSPPKNALVALAQYVGSIFGALLQVFAWVTGGFALAEYVSPGEPQKEKYSDWTPADLPELPNRHDLIPPYEPIIGIGGAVVLMATLNFAPQLFGIFQLELLRRALPAINVVFALSIAEEGLKLFYGKWVPRLAFVNTLSNIATIAVATAVFSPNAEIWNLYDAHQSLQASLKGWPTIFYVSVVVLSVVDAVRTIILTAKHSKS